MNRRNCPSTLAAGYTTYSPAALKRVFGEQNVSHILPYESVEKNEDDAELFMDNRKRISMSGVQSKYSMIVSEGKLTLTPPGKQGQYILKPKPAGIKNPQECPANENLTMQIAEQVFNIETAPNALCFFRNGEIAYIAKRFDLAADGSKYRVEDFASLAGATSENAGVNFKYDYSYGEMAELIKKYLPAWEAELLKFYRLILFNFLFSNGDAHLKNFSVTDMGGNDFRMAPAYDLLNTGIHVDDADFAPDRGLFKTGRPEFFKGGKACGVSFRKFGLLIGLPEKATDHELSAFTAYCPLIDELINNSFLSEKIKRQYRLLYQTRRNRLADVQL
jgi:serine/threonine-protein kinase HipA